MDIRNYITFNNVVEQNSFTKAATILNYAQSTVTLHIKELEEHYDRKLFDRIGKKIFPTTFGANLYKKTKQLEANYRTLLNFHKETNEVEELRIGGYESFFRYRMDDLIKEFKRTCPNVNLTLIYGTCKDLRDMVRNGELDLTFQIEPKRDFHGLKTQVLYEENFSLILPKNQTIDFVHNTNQTIYLTEKKCSYRSMFEDFLNKNKISTQHVMETGSVDMIKQYVSFGLGFSMVPRITVMSEVEKERLTILPFNSDTKLFTQLVYHKEKNIFPAMQNFITLVQKHLY